MFDQIPEEWRMAAIRLLGAVAGVIASVMMVAPEGTKNALYRVWVGVTMGVIFSPVVPKLPLMGWLAGMGTDAMLARAAFTAFVIWFLLEAIARLLSSNEWLTRLARDFLSRGGKEK